MHFVHLNLHTEFSLSDSVIQIKPLFEKLKAQNAKAVAITDLNNGFAWVKFYKAAIDHGIKPILGAECFLKIVDNPLSSSNHTILNRVTLLAKNQKGYKNLCVLLSKGFKEGQEKGIPHLDLRWLLEYQEGLILIFGQNSQLGQWIIQNNDQEICAFFDQISAIFKNNLYLGITKIGQKDENIYLKNINSYAKQYQLPIVATNDVRFMEASDFEAHEIRTCIASSDVISDPKRLKNFTPAQYLKSSEEMSELFKDIPNALINTVEIAKRCSVILNLGQTYLPDFPIPHGLTEAEFFKKSAHEGLLIRFNELDAIHFSFDRQLYTERLERELEVIINMGFSGYFLIVADFISWAKKNAIPVGPGRGSGAGSLVAWSLGITDLDPIPYDLLFERFLNPERVSMPDFDIDFCMEGRDRVIEYVADRYGHNAVSQIATHGTMAAKAVIRDVGRALGHPYGMVDKIAKMIPFEIGMTLSKALKASEDLKNAYEREEEISYLVDMALSLEGLSKSSGKHAGGVVISPTELTDFSPVWCEQGSQTMVTQFDKDDIELVGLVKFDFLGLRTLTIIDWTVQNIKATKDLQLNILGIPLNDKKTFDLLRSAMTTAVFQLESRGMKSLIHKLKPDTFEDLIALVALFRPGPLESGMVDDFINRKHGREEIVYPFAELEPVLKPTYGVIVYQEQVMQISQIIGNYSLGGADLLRRAMGKKKPEEMAKQRETFIEGAKTLNFDLNKAGDLFDLMEKFAGYGFNKSHSAAYALLSYQTAYLKANYPSEFMASVLSSDMDNTEKVIILFEECKEMEITVLAPSINHSDYKFTVNLDQQIIYGLGALKGLGEAAVTNIISERNENGIFKDLLDLCSRVDLSKVNKKSLETLIKSGALDDFCLQLDDKIKQTSALQAKKIKIICQHRANLLGNLPEIIKTSDQIRKNKTSGQNDLFNISKESQPKSSEIKLTTYLKSVPSWSEQILLDFEKETLGYYFIAHPLDQFRSELKQFVTHNFLEISEMPQPERRMKRANEPTVTVAGLVTAVRQKMTLKGSKIILLELDDKISKTEIMLNEQHLEKLDEPLKVDQIIIIKGSLGWSDFSGSMRINAEEVMTLEKMREKNAYWLLLEIDVSLLEQNQQKKTAEALVEAIKEGDHLIETGGLSHNTKMHLRYRQKVDDVLCSVDMAFPSLKIKPSQTILNKLNQLFILQNSKDDQDIPLTYGKASYSFKTKLVD